MALGTGCLGFHHPLQGWLLLPVILLRAPSPWDLSLEITPTSFFALQLPFFQTSGRFSHTYTLIGQSVFSQVYKTINSLISPFSSRSDTFEWPWGFPKSSSATQPISKGNTFASGECVHFHFSGKVTISKFWGYPTDIHCLQSSFTGYSSYYYLVYHFIHSFNKHLLSIYCASGIVLGAGNTIVGKTDMCPPEQTTYWTKDDHKAVRLTF